MNEQQPFGFFPGNPNGFFTNQSNQQCNCTGELRNISNRLNNMERQINRLERRVRRLELSNVSPYSAASSMNSNDFSSYNDDNYII